MMWGLKWAWNYFVLRGVNGALYKKDLTKTVPLNKNHHHHPLSHNDEVMVLEQIQDSHAQFKLGEEREGGKRREGGFGILQLAGFNFPPF